MLCGGWLSGAEVLLGHMWSGFELNSGYAASYVPTI